MLHSKKILSTVLFSGFIFLGACNTAITPPGGNGGLNSNSMIATLASDNFVSSDARVQVNDNDSTLIVLAHNDQTLGAPVSSISLFIPKHTPLPYTVSIPATGDDADAAIVYTITSGGTTKIFAADSLHGSGTITVTSLTPTVQGTFSGNLSPMSGSGDPARTVSGGQFNAQ